MSGEPRTPIRVEAAPDTVLALAIRALDRFPKDGSWALIGGAAVFLRLGSITRPTADADAVARSQAALIHQLVEDDAATVVSGGHLQVPTGNGPVAIDVMDLADEPLPGDEEGRAFALARRFALRTADLETIVVAHHGKPEAPATILLATTPALVALKTISMVRRPHGNSPAKVGSDIHDLVRLVTAGGALTIAAALADEPDLATWVRDHVRRAFGGDLRYTLLRLRRNDRSAGAAALSDAAIEGVGILADAIDQARSEDR